MPTFTAQSPRRAATVLLVRAANPGCEVLMLRRHGASGFAANKWVFPGGAVDEHDRTLPPERYSGVDVARLAQRFANQEPDVLGFHTAAVRETFEEAGILLADGTVGESDREQARLRLCARDADPAEFITFLERHQLVLDFGALTYVSRWITPRIQGRRFDTAFFLATCPPNQLARHDETETTARQWIRPQDALAAHRAEQLALMRPTITTLEWLVDHDSPESAAAAAAQRPTVPWNLPHIEHDDEGRRLVLLPTDADYPHAAYADELLGPIR